MDNTYQFIDGEWWYVRGKAKKRTRAIKRQCKVCGKDYFTWRSRFNLGGRFGLFCSKHCSGWRGGKKKIKGYIAIYKPDHPNCVNGKYVLEHRLVMEQHLGRYLNQDEHVHHINGCKDDNRLENLELWTGTHPTGVRFKDLSKFQIFTSTNIIPDNIRC